MSNLKQRLIVIKIVIAVLLEIKSVIHETPRFLAGSGRVLATTVDDWSESLLALAPVQAYAYVQ